MPVGLTVIFLTFSKLISVYKIKHFIKTVKRTLLVLHGLVVTDKL